MSVVTIRHPQAHRLADVAETWNDTLRGDWGKAVSRVCPERLIDPEQAERVLDDIGASFKVATFEPLKADLVDGAITFHADRNQTASALDLFMRIACGQWNEMRFHCTVLGDGYPADGDVDLTVLRSGFSKPYDDTLPWDDRGFPEHPFASISIAQAPLAARVAYHAYKALGAGASGSPTFSLPDGPLTIGVDGEHVHVRGRLS
jgi:hypothetical protein